MTTPHLAGCSATEDEPIPDRRSSPSTTRSGTARGKALLAYFSRAGENYYYGGRTNLKVGNTEVLARKISDLIDCDVHRIEPADPYPDSYDATVERNVREQDADSRPAIKGRLPDLDGYDTVLLGSPIWNVRAPMIMTTFTEQLDFTGKTVVPFTTHAMSGLGTTERDYAASCRGATFANGLAVQGEEADQADRDVKAWLQRIGLTTA
ncbi:flavodoxin [Streptomyces sp. NPDC008163]|uniref:flavodoxin n=1 Tax=Streptomyces sp. NPDC008163 TaxID=3364818 RepID=UPI0036EDBDF1